MPIKDQEMSHVLGPITFSPLNESIVRSRLIRRMIMFKLFIIEFYQTIPVFYPEDIFKKDSAVKMYYDVIQARELLPSNGFIPMYLFPCINTV